MSHFSRIQTKIKNMDHLVSALKTLGYNFVLGKNKCSGYRGQTTEVDLLIKLPNNSYNIGFVNNGNNIELVADWYGIRDINSNSLINSLNNEIVNIENKIKQQYAYEATIKSFESKGFDIIEEKNENGEIHIQLRRLQ